MIYNLKIEFRRAMGEIKEYKFNLLFANIGLIFLLTGLLEFVNTSNREVTLLLMITWYCGTHGFSNIAYILEDEITDGTIVNIIQSKVSLYYVIWMRAIIQIVTDLLKAIIVFSIIMLFFVEDIKYSLSFITVLKIVSLMLLSILITYGIGFCIGSLAIKHRRIISVASLFYYFILFFSGVIYNSPDMILFKTITILLPFSSLREILKGLVYIGRLNIYNVMHLLIIFIVWMIIGTAIFEKSVKKGLVTGSVYYG